MRNSLLLIAVSSSALVAGCARKAEQSFQDVAPAATSETAAPSAVAPLTQLSQEALARGDAAAAIPLAERALESAPNDLNATMALAQAQLMRGDPVKAEQLFRGALKSDASSAVANTGLGLSLLAQQRIEDAKRVLLTAAGQKSSVQTKSNIAFALTLAGAASDAIKLLEPIAMGKESTPTVRQNFAFALVMANDRARAFEIAGYDLDGVAAARQIASWTQTAHAPFKQRLTEMAGLTVVDSPTYAAAEVPTPAVVTPSAVATVAVAPAPEAVLPVKSDVSVAVPAQDVAQVAPVVATTEKVASVDVVKPAPVAKVSKVAQVSVKPVVLRPKSPVSPVVTASMSMPVATPVTGQSAAKVATATKFANWVVQVGAITFKSDQTKFLVKAFERRFGKSANVQVVAVDAPNGKLHRVLIGNALDRTAARNVCAGLRAKGRACFTRSESTVSQPVLATAVAAKAPVSKPVSLTPAAPVKMAAAKPVVLKAAGNKSASLSPVVTKAAAAKPATVKAPEGKAPAPKAAPAKDASKVVKI